MNKNSTYKKPVKRRVRQDTPVIVYFGSFMIGLLSYVIARFALGAYPHPIHWASGIVGAIVGYFLSWAWYHWRGDVI